MPSDDAKYQDRVQKWLQSNYGNTFRLRMFTMAFIHNRLPREFRFSGILHWLSRASLVCSGPAAAAFYGSVPIITAGIAAGAIFIVHNTTIVLDKISRRKRVVVSEQTELLVRFGDLLKCYKRVPINKTEKDSAIRSCLGILEKFAMNATKSERSEIAVSLVLYVGNSTTRMRIAHRNPGNERPVNRQVDAVNLLGHFACQHNGLPQVVNHIAHFGRSAIASPTQSSPAYKSIFVIPLKPVDGAHGANEKIRGFVSIDSARPYAFYGNRANDIIVTCEPVVAQLRELI